MANAIEPSVCGGDAALCQTICYEVGRWYTCVGDESAFGLQSLVSRDRPPLPVLAVQPSAGLLQRMRKRRCFADTDLDRSSLLSERVLLAHVAAASTSVTSPPSRHAVTESRAGQPTSNDRDVKATSCREPRDVTAGRHVTSRRERSPPDRQQPVADSQIEGRDVTALKSVYHSSSRRHVINETTTAVQQAVQTSRSTASQSSSPPPPSSSSSSKTTSLNFSVESLLAK